MVVSQLLLLLLLLLLLAQGIRHKEENYTPIHTPVEEEKISLFYLGAKNAFTENETA